MSFLRSMLAIFALGAVALIVRSIFDAATAPPHVTPAQLASLETTHPSALELENWTRTAERAGYRYRYWDYYGCIQTNFPSMTDKDRALAMEQAEVQLFVNAGQTDGPELREKVRESLSRPAMLAKLSCSRKWDWQKIEALEADLEARGPRKLVLTGTIGKGWANLDEMLKQTGWARMASLNHLSQSLGLLQYVKICARAPKRPGCEGPFEALIKNKEQQKLAASFDFSTVLTAADAPGRRVLLHRDPDVYLYSNAALAVTAADLPGAEISLSELSRPENHDSAARSMIEYVAELDGQYPAVSIGKQDDWFRALLGVAIEWDLRSRQALAQRQPNEFARLDDLDLVFDTKAPPPPCQGRLTDRAGFYCPKEATAIIRAPAPRQGAEDSALFGVELAVLNHELAHYAFHRQSWANAPFLDEGLATALGELSLRAFDAASLAAKVHDAAAIRNANLLFTGGTPTEIAAADTLVQYYVAKTALTPKQARLLCVLEKRGISAADIERHLKQSGDDFVAEGEVAYARGWILFDGEISGQSAKPLHDSTVLTTMDGLLKTFQSDPDGAAVTRARAIMAGLAARANARIAELKRKHPNACRRKEERNAAEGHT